jgi:4-hydroxy-tetrahydrodipicolinate synthase
MFRGSLVALITPMLADGQIDFVSLARMVDYQVDNGTDGLIIMGTTGEAATLTLDEQLIVLQAVIEQLKSKGVSERVSVIAGNGSNSTADAVAKTKRFDIPGVAGFLTVTPYYNKPTQKGMIAHFTAVAAATAKPILLYNVPGRTGVDLKAATVAELSHVGNIIGIKEATGSLERLAELKALCPAEFLLLSGDDASAADFLLQGGHGVISVTTNVAPAAMRAMISAALQGDTAAAHAADAPLRALHTDLFIEPNPIPAKWALRRLGIITDDFARLPLTLLEPNHHIVIEQALSQAKFTL